TVPQALSIALGAALVAVVDYRVLLLVMAVVVACSAVYLALPGRARREGQSCASPGSIGVTAGASRPFRARPGAPERSETADA
ncbi:MAG: hypothetical protein J2P32_04540, partial [Actinobacteria bacterium]|nr:hypothetical protein [Actinomycetota bacterium]